MAVFLYCAALTHFLADLFSHWMEKERGGFLLILHSFLYTLFFIPIFWFLGINYLWLITIFGSHLIIDSQGKHLLWVVKKILARSMAGEEMKKIIALGLDQVLHLLVLLIIALFIFK